LPLIVRRPRMIRLCSRFDSALFTPKIAEIPSHGNYSRSPYIYGCCRFRRTPSDHCQVRCRSVGHHRIDCRSVGGVRIAIVVSAIGLLDSRPGHLSIGLANRIGHDWRMVQKELERFDLRVSAGRPYPLARCRGWGHPPPRLPTAPSRA